MLGLLEYQTEVRPALTAYFEPTDKLFPLDSNRYAILTGRIVKKLKRINYKVESIKQLRASVITLWLKQYNLRKVQVMAGHRYISSTECYQQDDLENLIEMVNQFHPLQ
jgi:integrase/recombinase XerD